MNIPRAAKAAAKAAKEKAAATEKAPAKAAQNKGVAERKKGAGKKGDGRKGTASSFAEQEPDTTWKPSSRVPLRKITPQRVRARKGEDDNCLFSTQEFLDGIQDCDFREKKAKIIEALKD